MCATSCKVISGQYKRPVCETCIYFKKATSYAPDSEEAIALGTCSHHKINKEDMPPLFAATHRRFGTVESIALNLCGDMARWYEPLPKIGRKK